MKFSVTFFLIAQVAGGLFGGGEGGGGGGEGRVGSRLRCSFAHSTNKNARFANYFLLLILETPEGKTPYKRNNQAWPVFIKF